jgi:hypothetical protein
MVLALINVGNEDRGDGWISIPVPWPICVRHAEEVFYCTA